jgi:hypothetical protein
MVGGTPTPFTLIGNAAHTRWNFFRRKSVLNKSATRREILCFRIVPRCDSSHARD